MSLDAGRGTCHTSLLRRKSSRGGRNLPADAAKGTSLTQLEGSTSFVYFAQPVDGGPIKIGVTNDLRLRLSGLQTGSPVKLVLRHSIETDDAAQAFVLERSL